METLNIKNVKKLNKSVSHKSIHMYYDFYEFQEQAKLIYGDTYQNNSYAGRN